MEPAVGRGESYNFWVMEFIAKVEDSQRPEIREIAGALEKLGARVREVQPILGVIAGSSEGLSLEQLKVEGIASVEPDRNWGAGMPEGKAARGGKGEGAEKPEGEGRDRKTGGGGAEKPVRGAREAEERRAVAKRSGGKAKRKD